MVYLPYDYNDNKKYEILYLMHGAGGNNSTLMGNTTQYSTLKNIEFAIIFITNSLN